MKLEERKSGLLVPEQPKPPKPEVGPLEITDPHQRAEAAHALQALWRAWGLMSEPRESGINLPGNTKKSYDAKRAMWETMCLLMLGEILPAETYT